MFEKIAAKTNINRNKRDFNDHQQQQQQQPQPIQQEQHQQQYNEPAHSEQPSHHSDDDDNDIEDKRDEFVLHGKHKLAIAPTPVAGQYVFVSFRFVSI